MEIFALIMAAVTFSFIAGVLLGKFIKVGMGDD